MILGILQARMSSSRLPGKVLKTIMNRPMLELQLERLSRVKRMDKLIVATSDQPDDAPIAELCERLGVDCFRGSLHDVLERYYQAALEYQPDYIVRLTGDCPVTDPDVIDHVIDSCVSGQYDYVSNTIIPTYPHGLDVEVFPFASLEKAQKVAQLPYQREHVTPYLYQNPEIFNVANVTNSTNLSVWRWTVDEPEDFELISAIYEALYPNDPEFGTMDIVKFLKDHPEIAVINSKHQRVGELTKLQLGEYVQL
ncbi:MAG: glycosyltransferase family protein [candidate division Zixibacteria bacterium]|nr:glycosyltransferase family protein [candidate division Zixibacteria bacterium]